MGCGNAASRYLRVENDMNTVTLAFLILLRLVDELPRRIVELPETTGRDGANATKGKVYSVTADAYLRQKITYETVYWHVCWHWVHVCLVLSMGNRFV